jgi:hypothetical protein
MAVCGFWAGCAHRSLALTIPTAQRGGDRGRGAVGRATAGDHRDGSPAGRYRVRGVVNATRSVLRIIPAGGG